jgi:hypothetical protein
MRTRSVQAADRTRQEADSVRLRRSERLASMKAGQRRAGILAISLASAGVLLLAAVGIVVAVGTGKAPADEPAPSAPVIAPAVAAVPEIATSTDSLAVDVPAEPVIPPPAEKSAAKSASKPAAKPARKPAAAPSKQHFAIGIGDGYAPSIIRASSASPITLTVAKGDGCAAGFTIPELGIEKDNSGGPVTFSLGRLKAGTYRFACAMDMIEGRIVVK